jgi:hypothetical protein
MCSRAYAGPNPEKAPNTPRTLQGHPCNVPSLCKAGKKPETEAVELPLSVTALFSLPANQPGPECPGILKCGKLR